MADAAPQSDFSLKREQLPGHRVGFTVEVKDERRNAAREIALKKLMSQVSLKGFRPGKVPEDMARKHISDADLHEETLRALAPEIVRHAMEQGDVQPILAPSIDAKSLDPLVVYVTFVEEPIAKVKKLDAKKYAKTEPKADEKDVQRVIDQFMREAAVMTTVDRAAKSGDIVIADFWGEGEDKKEIENTRATAYKIEIGSNTLIPGFEDGVIGIKAGETKDVSVVFPENYQAKELQGKSAVFHISAKEVQEVKRPALTKEFIKEKLRVDKTPEELRADVFKNLIDEEVQIDRQRRERILFEELGKATAIDLAPELLDAESTALFREFSDRLSQQNLSVDDWFKASKKTMNDLKKELTESAQNRLTIQFGLRAILKEKNIEVTEEEITAEIAERNMHESHEGHAHARGEHYNDPRAREELVWSMKVKKFVDSELN